MKEWGSNGLWGENTTGRKLHRLKRKKDAPGVLGAAPGVFFPWVVSTRMKKKKTGKRGRPAAATRAGKVQRSSARIAPDHKSFRKAVEALRIMDEESRRRRSEFEAFVHANK